MKRIVMVSAALASILVLTACEREAAPAPPAEAQSAAANDTSTQGTATTDVVVQAPAATVEVVSEAAHAPVSPTAAAAASSFDTKAYAGRFAAEDTRLDITADGTFTLDQGDRHVSGTWTLEDDGKHLLFDPDSKSEPDRRYEMIGNDALQQVGDDSQRLLRDKH